MNQNYFECFYCRSLTIALPCKTKNCTLCCCCQAAKERCFGGPQNVRDELQEDDESEVCGICTKRICLWSDEECMFFLKGRCRNCHPHFCMLCVDSEDIAACEEFAESEASAAPLSTSAKEFFPEAPLPSEASYAAPLTAPLSAAASDVLALRSTVLEVFTNCPHNCKLCGITSKFTGKCNMFCGNCKY